MKLETGERTVNFDLPHGDQDTASMLYYIVNNILYQRSVYPSYKFVRVTKYGLPLMVVACEKRQNYLQRTFSKLHELNTTTGVRKVALVLGDIPDGVALERWEFHFAQSRPNRATFVSPSKQHALNGVGGDHLELQRVFQSISSMACFMKPLPRLCEFDIELTISRAERMPDGWEALRPNLPSAPVTHTLSTLRCPTAEVQIELTENL